MLLAMVIGGQCLLLALSRYEALRAGLSRLFRAGEEQQSLAMALWQLARDLRRDGQAGCQGLPADPRNGGAELFLSWGQSGWHIVDSAWQTTDGTARLTGLTVRAPDEAEVGTGVWLLTSCSGKSELRAGDDVVEHSAHAPGLRQLILTRSIAGHDRATLEIGAKVERHYRYADGHLSADGQPLAALSYFAASLTDEGLWRIRLVPTGAAARHWRLDVARRQRGMVFLVVLTLIAAATLLLGASARLLLDDNRQLHQQQQWIVALFRAEFALNHAHQRLQALTRQPVDPGWFQPDCRNEHAPKGWRRGLCTPAKSGALRPAWERGTGFGVLSPCIERDCIGVAIPGNAGGVGKSCADDLHEGPIDPAPCFIVERLAAPDQAGGLYRITARAWGQTIQSRVTLQSYYRAETGERLGWRLL